MRRTIIKKAIAIIIAIFLFKMVLMPIGKYLQWMQTEKPFTFTGLILIICLIITIVSVSVAELFSTIKKEA